MNNALFIPLIGILGLLSTFITSKGALYDKRYKWWRRLTKRGYSVLCMGLVIVGLSCWQYISTKNEDKREKEIELITKRQTDSTITSEIRKGVDSNRKLLFEDLSEALAKQNLRLDTVNKNIETIRDSARNVINNYPQADPILDIDSNGIVIDKKNLAVQHVSIKITSHEAGSANFNITCFLIIDFKDGSTLKNTIADFLEKNTKIGKDGSMHTGFNTSPKEILGISLGITGSYTTIDGKKKYSMDEAYKFDPTTSITNVLINSGRENFLKRFKTNK